MARDTNLNAYLYFESVGRRGSVALAAEELFVSPSAVSQQIKALELQMGIKLFRRSGRKLVLTLEGEQLYSAASAAIGILKNAQTNLSMTRETSRLNLRVTPSFGVRWLGPRLSDFVFHNPNLDLRIDAAPDPTDFDREIMDLDIRYGLGGWSGLTQTPLVTDYVLPLCSPAYRDQLIQACPNDPLSTARLIDSARALCKWDFWLHNTEQSVQANTKKVLMDRSSMALQLALDGAGVVLESLALCTAEVESGTLVPLTPHLGAFTFTGYWCVCPERHLKRRVVKDFIAWITDEVARYDARVVSILTAQGIEQHPVDLSNPITIDGHVEH